MSDGTSRPAESLPDDEASSCAISPAASEIMQTRPRLWEHRLFATVLVEECRKVAATPRRSFLPDGSNSERLDVVNSFRLVVQNSGKFGQLIKNVASVIDRDLVEALGPPGVPGDANKLVAAAHRVAELYRSTVELISIIELTEIDALIEDFADEMATQGRVVVETIEKWADQALDAFAAIDSGKYDALGAGANITLTMKWEYRQSYRLQESLKQVEALMTAIGNFVTEALAEHALSPNRGYLYLAINPSMDGLVKIGKTTRTPKDRIQELSSATGVPSPFILLFDIEVGDCAAAEAYVHRKLETLGYRISQSREFFRVPTSEAVKIMLESEGAFPPRRVSTSQS